MSKILFCDFLFETGNRHVDNYILDILAENNEVFLLMNEDFICGELKNRKNITILGNKHAENKKGALSYKYQTIKRMYLAAKTANKLMPDIIYISVYETRLFPLALLFFRHPEKIVIVENYNIDFLRFKLQLLAYRLYANRVHHLVYESIFKDHLINIRGIRHDHIHVVPHTHYKSEYDKYNTEVNDSYDCIAISGSNDPLIVSQFVEYEKKTKYLEKNNIHCLIKSKIINHESKYLKVSSDFIPTSQYNALYKHCKVVFVPFSLSYKYRMSGCIVDAFSCHKPVVSSNLELTKFYKKHYSSIISPCSSIEEMFENIVRFCKTQRTASCDFEAFEREHGYGAIKTALNEMIKKIQAQ